MKTRSQKKKHLPEVCSCVPVCVCVDEWALWARTIHNPLPRMGTAQWKQLSHALFR